MPQRSFSAVAVATAAGAALVLSSCAGAPTAPEEPGEPASSIRMINVEGASGRMLETAIALFEEESGIDIEYASLGINEAIDQQILGLASGSTSFDVVLVESGYTSQFANGMLPLDDFIAGDADFQADEIIGSMQDLFEWDGTTYAIPIRVGGRVFMYNEQMLADAGITKAPTTAAELRKAAAAVTDGTVFGYTGTLQQGNFLATQWTPWLRSFGSEVLTENLECSAFNDDAGVEATEFFVDLYQDRLMPPDSIEFENGAMIGDLAVGRSAMGIGYSGWYGEIVNPETSSVTDVMRIAPGLPHGPDVDHWVTDMGGWGLGINGNVSEAKQSAAWEFAKFVSRPDIQLKLAVENGNAPVVESVFEDASYQEAVPDAANVLATYEHGTRQRPQVASYGEIEQILSRVLSQALVGDISPAKALEDAEAEINALLGGSC